MSPSPVSPGKRKGAYELQMEHNLQILPDYFRIMHEPVNNNVVHMDADGKPARMYQVISKSSGWITVTPRHKNRKRPIEKQALGDVKKVNVLSPVWMQVDHVTPEHDPMKPYGVTHGIRKETNRTFLVEKSQPKRSVFSIGSTRHNVASIEDARHWQQVAVDKGFVSVTNPDRMIGWKEEPGKQSYDRGRVSPKIGSAHFN